VTFANPLAFWLLAGAAPLLAMYFLKVRRKRVRVPSVLLWAGVVQQQRKARPWDRFRRHDLLWLQLLALLLLTLALARPSVPGRKLLGRSVVWVLDASASMGAMAPSPTRFERARDVVLAEIDRLGPGDEGMILWAGPEPRVAASFTRDTELLSQAVRALEPSSSSASLGGAVDLAAALAIHRPERTIVVVSDGSDRSLDGALSRHPDLRIEEVGRPAANVAITAIDLRRSPTRDLESELFVTLRRFGGATGPVGVEVTLDGELVTTESVELPPDRAVARVYRGLGSAGGLVRVHLETGDALPADDDAVAWLEPPTRRRVLCVGCTSLTGRALATDDRFDVVVGAADEPGFDVVVFEDAPVPASPSAPFVALGPPRVGEEAASAEVAWPSATAWKAQHPVLRFVEPGGLLISKARPGGDAFEPLLESDQGPLITTGVVGGVRGVIVHFRPVDSDLPLRVAYPLLLLNTVGWLTGEEARGTSRTLAAGAPLVREGWGDDGDEVVLRTPDGSERTAPIRDGVARFGALEQVGVYRITGPAGRQERVAANLVSETESDLAVFEAQATGAVEGQQVRAPGRLPLTRPALGLLAFLLLGEWALYWRKYAE